KSLHDHLHVLRVQYFRQIADAVTFFRANESMFQILESYVIRLKGETERARAAAASLRSRRREEDWIGVIEQATSELDQALNGTDDGRLLKAVASFRRILAEEPIRINALLTDIAGDLRLEQIIQAMTAIRASLDRPGPGNDNLPVQEFRDGLQSLQGLQPRLG